MCPSTWAPPSVAGFPAQGIRQGNVRVAQLSGANPASFLSSCFYYTSTASLVYTPATKDIGDISKIQVCTRGVSLSPSLTLPNPAGEKLCRLQSPWSGGVPLGYYPGESSHLSKS